MSPKKAAAKRQGRTDIPSQGAAATLNASFLDEVKSAFDHVVSHEVFRTAFSRASLGFGRQGAVGVQEPFNLQNFQSAIAEHGIYRCACNEWWLDLFHTVLPGIPYNKGAIKDFATTAFHVPGGYQGVNVVLVPDRNYNPLEHKGALKRLSPEEPMWGRILGIKAAIDRGVDEETLQRFAIDVVCAPFQFEYVEEAASNPMKILVPRALNLREQLVAEGRAEARDCLQRMFEVVQTGGRIQEADGGKVTNDRIAAWYADRIRLSPGSEPVTRTFVETATNINKMILNHAPCLGELQIAAERWQGAAPLQSVYKLALVITKANRDKELMLWCMSSVHDVCRMGFLSVGEVTTRALKDGAGGNKGLLDLFILKKQLLHHFMTLVVEKYIGAPHKEKLRATFKNHEVYHLILLKRCTFNLYVVACMGVCTCGWALYSENLKC